MEKKDNVKISKFLSLVLRHQPATIGLRLDKNGWANVEELIRCSSAHGMNFSLEDLHDVVRTNDKKRFAYNEDGTKIRASQGHSVSVDLGLEPRIPPDVLFHGTATRFLPSIRMNGLTPQSRQQVHLSEDENTARIVGSRHGKPVVLKIDAKKMHGDGWKFFCSENGVWLVERVFVGYFEILE